MKVTLLRPWKNHRPGEVLDVSDGVHGDLIKLGVLDPPAKADASPKITKEVRTEVVPDVIAKAFKRALRHKMVESPDVYTKHTEEGGE